MCEGLIFVQHLFDSIYIYQPFPGVLRRVSFIWSRQSFAMSTDRTEVTFNTVSGLFTTDFYSVVAQYMISEKKQKRGFASAKDALQLCRTAADILFGPIGADFMPRPIVADDLDLGDRGFFSRSVKGALMSIETCGKPVIFVTTPDLRALPFEFMFAKNLVLRGWNYAHILIRPSCRVPETKPIVCRADQRPEDAARRTVEAIDGFLQGCGSGSSFVPFVAETGRIHPLPSPLLSQNREMAACRAKFPFCQFEELTLESSAEGLQGLYVFTYTDFCEMPEFLRKMGMRSPFAYCMFIPILRVKEAFDAMALIFERQQRRIQFAKQDVNVEMGATGMLHCVLAKVPYDFITILQGTLMEILGCPIILICPVH
jgi:hypothetical protein